jgi:RNA polymerase sigma-70 factor (ECF subfamily)
MAGSNFEDTILYSRIKRKDRDSFIKAYDKYVADIYRFVYFKVSDKEIAEDITSQTFLKSWGHIQNNSLEDYKTLRALFYRVARNIVIDHYRKTNNEQNISLDSEENNIDIIDEGQSPIRDIESSQDKEELMKYLDELKDEYREVLVMRYLNEMSITEIAEVLNKNKGNIRVLSFRALKALRELMEK